MAGRLNQIPITIRRMCLKLGVIVFARVSLPAGEAAVDILTSAFGFAPLSSDENE